MYDKNLMQNNDGFLDYEIPFDGYFLDARIPTFGDG